MHIPFTSIISTPVLVDPNLVKTEITKCTCETKELFWRGCKCGWWEKEKALKNENNSRSVEGVGV